MPDLTPELRRGRLLLLIAIAVTLIGEFCVITMKVLKVGFRPDSFASITRWFLTIALFYIVWRGQSWMRWVLVGLFGWGLLLAIPLIFRSPHPLIIGITLQFSIAIALLAFPRVCLLSLLTSERSTTKTPDQSLGAIGAACRLGAAA